MGENIQGIRRTHNCGNIGLKDIGLDVIVMGWVQKRRDHGGVIFIDVRDRSGLVQVVFNPDIDPESFAKADTLRSEYVVAIEGKVRKRPEGNINSDLKTGELELKGANLRILDESKTPPIQIKDELDVGEDLRLKYRYLDLRRPMMQKIIRLRHEVMKKTRDYLDNYDFLEIETPILTKSTPEGARDYLVPSRINSGHFYALPQSPQLFKQLLMASGMERYFQIARCFRDEDLRANRQPEFTQIDIEMSFVSRDELFETIEGLIREIFYLADIKVPDEIPIMTYDEAMERFGSDKPDMRFAMELEDITDIVKDSEFRVFSATVTKGGQVKGINVKQGAAFPRSKIDQLTEYVKLFKAKGLAWMVVEDSDIKSPIAKFLSEDEIQNILEKMDAEKGDLLLFVADNKNVVASALGNLRLKIAREQNIISDNEYKFSWIVDFPLLEYDENENRFVAKHHPFTSPRESDIHMLENKPEDVKANAYDLVLNGEELGGGSIRINDKELQEKVFNALNIDKKEASDKFGFLLEAFEYGTPPHGGIAFGLDRIIMILSSVDSIRDVIAFPKTQKATSPLTGAPSFVTKKQLKELNIKTDL